MNGHLLLANTLRNLGVTHVFSVSGSPIKETLPACSQAGMRVIGVHHQQAGAFMALAHNYVAGRPTAVVVVSAGPAVTNAATSLLVAKDNCWPLVVIGGKTSGSANHRPGTFQLLDGAGLMKPLVKWAAEIHTAADIPEYVNHAFQVTMTGSPGPVYLDVPVEVLNARIDMRDTPPLPMPQMKEPDILLIDEAAECLMQAARPAVIIGKGVRWANPFRELRLLIETYQIPFMTSPMGRGFLSDDHPLCCNAARDFLQEHTDTVLLLGAQLNWTFRFGTQFSPHLKLIHVDIDREHLAHGRQGSVLIEGDVKVVLQALLSRLKQIGMASASDRTSRREWGTLLHECMADTRQERERRAHDPRHPMTLHRLMHEIRDFLPSNAICVMDGRDSMAAAQEILGAYVPASRFTAGSNGCMGVGIPFAIGAKLCAPDRMVIAICGDMAFGISAMEMETAVRHKIPVCIVVVNNDGPCASQDQLLYPPGHDPIVRYLPRIPYEKIMESFGGFAESIDRAEQVKPALARAAQSGLPALLNVYVDKEAPFRNYLG